MQKENRRLHKGGRVSREGSVGKDGQAGSATCKPSKSLEKMGSFGKADNVVSRTVCISGKSPLLWLSPC